MIEAFVMSLIEKESKIFNDLLSYLPPGENISADKIAKSSLSEFTKNYLVHISGDGYEPAEMLDRIQKANKLRFNYAIRPKWTLITYMFGSYESRPPAEISRKLELFPFYNFYIDSINDVLKDNFSIFITRNEVSLMIDETNKAIYRKLTSDINNAKIKNFFLQIFLLKYNEHELTLESTVPYAFIKLFLNDKYYFDLEKKFHFVKGINDDYEISLKDVIKVLMNKFDFGDAETSEKPVQEPDIVTRPEPVHSGTPVAPPVKAEETSEEKPVPEEPVIKRIFRTERKAPMKPSVMPEEQAEDEVSPIKKVDPKPAMTHGASDTSETEISPAAKPVKPEREKITVKSPDKPVKATVTDERTSAPKEADTKNDKELEIKKLFSDKQFDRILDKVYHADFELVTRSFIKLGNFKTWFEASNHLKELFKANEVDIYNKDVLFFVDTLNDHYSQRG